MMMKSKISLLASLFVATLSASDALATSITYDLNVSASSGSGGFDAITGTVTTDGTIGMLSTKNILSYNEIVSDQDGSTDISSSAGAFGI